MKINDDSMEWYDSYIWYDPPEWYKKEEKELLDKYFSDDFEDKYDNIKSFLEDNASKRFNKWSKNFRIQKQKDRERGKIVN